MRRGEPVRAQPPKKNVQAIQRVEHLRAQPRKTQVQAVRRIDIFIFPPNPDLEKSLGRTGYVGRYTTSSVRVQVHVSDMLSDQPC
jgi:hypothetical protein